MGDTFSYNWFLNGVAQTYNGPSVTLDTTSVFNGQVNVGLMITDSTNGLSYNQGALEWSRTVTVNNSATGAETWGNAGELFLHYGGTTGGGCDAAAGNVGSCTLTPKLIATDSSTVSSPTFYYYAANSNATLSGATCTSGTTGTFCTGSSATVTAAAIGPTRVLTTGVTHSGTDGGTKSGNTQEFVSASYPFYPSDYHRMLYITGGTNCVVGAYLIEGLFSGGFVYLSDPADGSPTTPLNFATGTTSSCQWYEGPTRTIWTYSGSGVPNVAHYSICGSVLTSYVATGTCASRYMGEIFTSGGASSEFVAQPYPTPYGQSFANSGYNTVEFGLISGSTAGLTGTQAAWVATEYAYLQGQLAYITPWPVLRALGTFINWIGPNQMLQFEFGTPSASNWTGYTSGSETYPPSGVATLMYLAAQTNMFVMAVLGDEIDTLGFTWPLQGPIQPAASGTVKNWLNDIVCNGTTCTANTFTTTPNGAPSPGTTGKTFTITGSATTGMNSVYPALYTIASSTSTSFTFANTAVAAGTYSVSNDPGLTIQTNGTWGWFQNNLTSAYAVMNWDAWASFVNQLNSVTPHIPFGGSISGGAQPISDACWGRAVASACGQSINTANTGGNTISNVSQINDIYTTHVTEYYLRARQSANSIISDWGSDDEEGYKMRNLVDVLDPAWPLTVISQGLTRDYILTGNNNYTVTSCTGNTITFSAAHNIVNIVSGATRLSITGSTDANCNTSFYVIAAPTPTKLSVVYAAPKTTCNDTGSGSCGYNNAGSATLTFANGDKIGVGSTLLNNNSAAVPMYQISTDGAIRAVGSGSNDFNYGTAANSAGTDCGGFSVPGIASNAVTRDRGQFFTLANVGGAGASYFNSTTFYYAIENLSTPVAATGGLSPCNNYFYEVPVLSGTGGTASIIPDNFLVEGRNPDDFIAGNTDPDYAYLSVVECQLLRCAGNRMYEAEQNPQSYNNTPVTLNGTLHKGLWTGAAQSNVEIFSETFAATTHQLGVHPNVEDDYSVPNWHAGSFANMMAERTQKFYLGSTPLGSPDYGPEVDSGAFSSAYGHLLIVGNFSNGPQTRTVALCADPRSLCTSDQNIIRYIADARGIYGVDVITAGTASDTLMLQEGQAAWYAFPVAFTGELSQPSFSARLADVSGATGWAIRYGYDQYLLDSNTANVYNCGSSQVCTPPIDLNIGGAGQHFYRIIYYKLSGGFEIPLALGGVQTM